LGALLVAADGRVLGLGENTQVTDEHVLAHAEMNLLQRARSSPTSPRGRSAPGLLQPRLE
jgi:tRNA(Arg) A34 adenosine deaminase TadA